MQTLPFSEARAQFAEALRSVEAGNEPVLISRRGQAAGVLMSVEQYRELGGDHGFIASLQRWRDEYLADVVDADAADPFDGLRQTESGRDFKW